MLGIDLGSRSIKIVQMNKEQIVKTKVYDTIAFYRSYGQCAGGKLQINFDQLGFADNEAVVATGYGKITVQVEGAHYIPEIQAHVKGAVFQSGLRDFTLIDIGGQDTKIVQVRDGRAVDFRTNDRCAASSGRYIENMAAILGISVEEMGQYSTNPVELNSTCAIFGETEIIARIVEGYSTAELAAGVNYSLFRRCAAMLGKLSSPTIVMSGGGALNKALADIISRETKAQVRLLPYAQLNGAIGCCVYGYELNR